MSPPTPSRKEIEAFDGLAQAALIRNGSITQRELAESAIERIEAADRRFNLIATPLFDEALRDVQVAYADERQPFCGVPFLVKDLIARVAGSRQTEGSRMLASQIAESDSPLVSRYRAAGLSILGRTTTSEFGHAPVTEGQLFGVTRNPWSPGHTSGGSSGGAAVAVATRCVPVAHGNDAGGSLRIPASCCGVFALKPGRGRQPMDLEAGAFNRYFVSEHVISVSVRDSAALLDFTAVNRPSEASFLNAVQGPPDGQMRIAAQVEPVVEVPVSTECARAVEQTAAALEQFGHSIETTGPGLDGSAVFSAWFGLWADAIGWQVREAARRARREPDEPYFDTMTWELYNTSLGRTPLDSLDDLLVLDRAAAVMADFLAQFDAWLTPTLAQPPLLHGAFRSAEPGVSPYLRFSPFARLANISGHPACSLPGLWTDAGLPIGVQLIGRSELELFALASELEKAMPWVNRVPSQNEPPSGAAP